MLNAIRRLIGRQILRHLFVDPLRVLLAATGPSTIDQLTNHTGARRQIVINILDHTSKQGCLEQDPFHTGRYRVTDTGRPHLDRLLRELSR